MGNLARFRDYSVMHFAQKCCKITAAFSLPTVQGGLMNRRLLLRLLLIVALLGAAAPLSSGAAARPEQSGPQAAFNRLQARASGTLIVSWDRRSEAPRYLSGADPATRLPYRPTAAEVGNLIALAQASFGGLMGWFMAEAKFTQRPAWFMPLGFTVAAVLNGLFSWLIGEVSAAGLEVEPIRSLILGLLVALATFGALVWLMNRSTEVTLRRKTK